MPKRDYGDKQEDDDPFMDDDPVSDDALVKEKTPLLENHPCKKCSCLDFEPSSPGDNVCTCGHKESDHKDFEWTTAK